MVLFFNGIDVFNGLLEFVSRLEFLWEIRRDINKVLLLFFKGTNPTSSKSYSILQLQVVLIINGDYVPRTTVDMESGRYCHLAH